MRSHSAPPTRSVPADTPDQQLGHSNGCGGASPTGRAEVLALRAALIHTWLAMMPLVRVSAWKGHAYFAIWWNPLPGSPSSIMRPEKWHTTLLRAWPKSIALDALVQVGQNGEAIANAILRALTPVRFPNGSLRCHVVPPPWRNSWNFGVPPQAGHAIPVIHEFLKQLMLSADPECTVIEEADSHISWH